jgi:hypothetical protein
MIGDPYIDRVRPSVERWHCLVEGRRRQREGAIGGQKPGLPCKGIGQTNWINRLKD